MHGGLRAVAAALSDEYAPDRSQTRMRPQVKANVAGSCESGRKPIALWRRRPFLLGAFSNADAMYAPVVSGSRATGIPVSPASRSYMNAVMARRAGKEWEERGGWSPW